MSLLTDTWEFIRTNEALMLKKLGVSSLDELISQAVPADNSMDGTSSAGSAPYRRSIC
jgi:glycine cleavage system pyridoxal-binding protein P